MIRDLVTSKELGELVVEEGKSSRVRDQERGLRGNLFLVNEVTVRYRYVL
jgi:hypothetical protein